MTWHRLDMKPQRKPGVLLREEGTGGIAYDLQTGRIVRLSAPELRVLCQLDGQRTAREVASAPPPQGEAVLMEAIEQLAFLGLCSGWKATSALRAAEPYNAFDRSATLRAPVGVRGRSPGDLTRPADTAIWMPGGPTLASFLLRKHPRSPSSCSRRTSS